MAFGKKKNKGLKLFLRGLFLILVALVLVITGYLLLEKKLEGISSGYETQIQLLKEDVSSLRRTVYLCETDLTAGAVLQKEQLLVSEISASLVQGLFMTEADFGKVLLVDVKANTPIMKGMLFEEIIGSDTREEELNMVFLPTNLQQNHYVDVRIGFPNGEDYIVLTKMKVRDLDLERSTMWLWVDEKEIMTLSSAIVDAYLHKGTKLYTVTYVAPSLQEEAVPNYPVNTDVLRIIQTDPNILAEARLGLSADLRKALDLRLERLTEEALSSVDNGIKKEASDRAMAVDETSQVENDAQADEAATQAPTQPATQPATQAATQTGTQAATQTGTQGRTQEGEAGNELY